MSESLPTTSEWRARGSTAPVVLLGVVLLGCTSHSSSAPTKNDSVAAPPETIAPPPATPEVIEPAPEARAPIDFDPSAVLFGSCGEFASDYDDHQGPFVVGSEVVPWAEGEPLWIMTNAGGVVEAVAGRRLDQCDEKVPPEEAPVGEREDGEDGDDEDPPCVPAVAIVTDKPLVCDPILAGGIPAPLSLGDHDRERGFLFALPRHVRPPPVITMRFEVRVEGLCWPVEEDDDTLGVRIPIKAEPAPMDRHFTRRVPRSKARRWRALTVHYTAPEHPPAHVYYSVDRRTPHREAQWDVFVGDPEGSLTSWVRTADRRVFDSGFVRDRNCGIPYSNPSPILAFVHDERLHWITIDESETIEARIWRFDEDALTPVRTIPGKLYTHYF